MERKQNNTIWNSLLSSLAAFLLAFSIGIKVQESFYEEWSLLLLLELKEPLSLNCVMPFPTLHVCVRFGRSALWTALCVVFRAWPKHDNVVNPQKLQICFGDSEHLDRVPAIVPLFCVTVVIDALLICHLDTMYDKMKQMAEFQRKKKI